MSQRGWVTIAMELVANVWPVVDAGTGLVLRYFMRAYVVNAEDRVISATLRALAPADFRMAKMFTIPPRFRVVSEHGELTGCVSITDFYTYQSEILAPAFAELEKGVLKVQGIGEVPVGGQLAGIGDILRFPTNPYLVVTSLLEMPNGELVPKLRD